MNKKLKKQLEGIKINIEPKNLAPSGCGCTEKLPHSHLTTPCECEKGIKEELI